MFQHTAARRRLAVINNQMTMTMIKFQHTAARRRLGFVRNYKIKVRQFQHTAARRRLVAQVVITWIVFVVSTHSRPKAAGRKPVKAIRWTTFQHTAARRRLAARADRYRYAVLFQHTAARRRLESSGLGTPYPKGVSTHSRPKAAGYP